MATVRLHDEPPTKQEQECALLGENFYPDEEDAADDEPAFGADPFDIVSHREEHGIVNDDA